MGSKKRKFYVVRRGRVPGIYTDWDSTQAQVQGFPAAEYKSFGTLQEAEAYARGIAPAAAATPAAAAPPTLTGAAAAPLPTPTATAGAAGGAGSRAVPPGVVDLGSRGGAIRYYGIKRGRQTGVFFGSWADCQKLVSGYPGALFKGFSSADEAFEWVGPVGGAVAQAGSAQAAPVHLPTAQQQPQGVGGSVSAGGQPQQQQGQQQQLKRRRLNAEVDEGEEEGELMVTMVGACCRWAWLLGAGAV